MDPGLRSLWVRLGIVQYRCGGCHVALQNDRDPRDPDRWLCPQCLQEVWLESLPDPAGPASTSV